MADARGEREAAIKDLNIVAGELEIDPILVRSKQSDIEAFWKKLCSSIPVGHVLASAHSSAWVLRDSVPVRPPVQNSEPTVQQASRSGKALTPNQTGCEHALLHA